MSRWTDNTSRARRDAGFTLVEIMVALGVITVVLMALLPQLVVGIRATGTARTITQAKGVAQGELERMRNLPYHIAPAAGDYVDVLDYHYRNVSLPGVAPTCRIGGEYTVPVTGWRGFVAAGSSARCDYEPSAGAFYRTVKQLPAAAGTGSFTVLIDVQFLSDATPPVPVSPLADYDTQVEGKDKPPTSQLGVQATVFATERGKARPITTYTQIARRLPTSVRLTSIANARVLEIGSATPDGVPVSLSSGILNLTGTVSNSSTVHASMAGAAGGLATGEQSSGASYTGSAPPDQDVVAMSAPAGGLVVGGCSYACWGSTARNAFALRSGDGRPIAGSAAGPVQSRITDAVNNGLSFGNTTTASGYRTGLALTPPLVRLDPTATPFMSGLAGCAVGATGADARLAASGYLTATASSVEACAVGRSTAIELFPTTFASRGVVRVTLEYASASCRVQGSAHTPAAGYDYRAVVEYWNGSGYTSVGPIVPGQAVDALAAVPLTTSIGGGRTLGDYISSWSALTVSEVVVDTEGASASVALPGVVTITTRGVRPDPTAPTPTPTPTASPSPTPTTTTSPTATPTSTATSSPTATAATSPTATATTSPTSTTSPSPTPTVDLSDAADPASALSVAVGALSCTTEDRR